MKLKVDWKLLFFFLAIPVLSLLVLYSAGYDSSLSIKLLDWLPLEFQSRTFVKQFINLMIGIVVMLFVMSVNVKFIQKLPLLLYALTVILLLIVLLMGHKSHGSVRWIPLGFMNFQPSELAKAGMIFIFAWYLTKFRPREGFKSWVSLIKPVLILALPLLLILKQPDLGTGLSVAMIAVGMMLLAGLSKKILFISTFLFLMFLPLIWNFGLKEYQRERAVTFLNPEQDPYGSGYHIIQSKIAVGSGMFTGKGFLNGSQTQLEYLPEHTTDFAFSVLAEEWGFVGCSILLFLYLALILRLFRLAENAPNQFQSYFCFGFAILIATHVFINVGMVLGLLPVVGLPLPLFSYGGSSLLVIMFLAGVALNISASRSRF